MFKRKYRFINFKTALKRLATVVIMCLSIFAAAEVYLLFIRPNLINLTNKEDSSKTTSVLPTVDPDYETVAPSGKNIDDLGGWKLISPPNNDPVYAFVDKIDNTEIIISQQQLPEDFKDNPEQKIAELAKDFNATNRFMVGTTNVYIGISVDGPQSVIFTVNNLLVLIKSDTKISDAKWADYITSLQ